jgi:hypothetical protein
MVRVSGGRFQISDSAVFRELDGEAVILHLDSGTYFGLDRIGTRVWQLLETHGSIDRVVRELLDEFDVDADRLTDDVERLVSEMLQKGLIVSA